MLVHPSNNRSTSKSSTRDQLVPGSQFQWNRTSANKLVHLVIFPEIYDRHYILNGIQIIWSSFLMGRNLMKQFLVTKTSFVLDLKKMFWLWKHLKLCFDRQILHIRRNRDRSPSQPDRMDHYVERNRYQMFINLNHITWVYVISLKNSLQLLLTMSHQ